MSVNGPQQHCQSDIIPQLAGCQVLRDLPDCALEKLAERIKLRQLAAGRIFFPWVEQEAPLQLIFQGRVHLAHHSVAGKKLVVAELGPGELLGVKGLFGKPGHNLTAEAIEASSVGIIYKDDFTALIQEYPALMVRLLECLCRRMERLEQAYVGVAFHSVKSRLATFLLESANGGSATPKVKGLTHQHIGEIIGTYRETVTTTLSELQAQGLISIERKCIGLLDLTGLQSIIED